MSDLPAVRNPGALAAYVQQPQVMTRFEQVLGKRTPQFLSSLMTLHASNDALKKCDPQTIIAAAMTAATMDLPLQKDLGFAHIVPYGNVASFIIGAKGFVQLAMRTGQYSRMNAVAVNAECFQGYDEIGEPVLNWALLDDSKPIVGYAFGFKMVNGFTKLVYWSKAKVEAHAQRYSRAYQAKMKNSPWMNNFDAMALKTVVKNALSKWGILSVEMQQAMTVDQGVIGDDGVQYPDNPDELPTDTTNPAQSRTEGTARKLAATLSGRKRGRPPKTSPETETPTDANKDPEGEPGSSDTTQEAATEPETDSDSDGFFKE